MKEYTWYTSYNVITNCCIIALYFKNKKQAKLFLFLFLEFCELFEFMV